MKKRIFYIFLAIQMMSLNMLAQTLSPFVLSSAGQSASAGGAQLSWNLGETFTSTASNSQNILTHGFEQPELQIWTGNINMPVCGNGQVIVPYIATGVMSSSNIFTAELSDAYGNFSNALAIGSLTSKVNGSITALIPNTIPTGTGYRIRVRSSMPVFTGMDNGTDLAINNRASIPDAFAMSSGTDANTIYAGYSPAASLSLTANVSGTATGATYSWKKGNVAFGTTKSITVTAPDIYTVVVTVAGCTYSASKRIELVNVACPQNGNKEGVWVCHQNGQTNCVSVNSVPSQIKNGAMLGSCNTTNYITLKTSNVQMPEEVMNKGIFEISAYPNPSSSQFTLQVQSDAVREKISLRVYNISGRVVEMMEGLSAQQVVRIGANYIQGIYIVEMIQGVQRKQIKLIKQ